VPVTARTRVEVPRGGPSDPRVKFVEYEETEVYRIVGTFRAATQIVLSDDETIQHVALGDTVSWEVAVAGHILFLKPRERAGPTNLIVTTSRGGELRSYAFERLPQRPHHGPQRPSLFSSKFRYPRDDADRAERLRAAQIAMQAAALEAGPFAALDHAVARGLAT
jgi:type IV secretion system protein VirB9